MLVEATLVAQLKRSRVRMLHTVVDVTNEKNGRTVRVKVNDRGPFVAGRIVDLSRAAAAEIDAVKGELLIAR